MLQKTKPVRTRLHVETLQTQYFWLNPIGFLQGVHFLQKVSIAKISHTFFMKNMIILKIQKKEDALMKHLLMKSLIFALFFNLNTLRQTAWALQAPDFTVSASKTLKTIEITALPPSGTHINIQAPMSLLPQGTSERIQPHSTQVHQVIFSVPLRAPQPYEISLFLCDNQNTFCEKHKVTFTPDKLEKLPLASGVKKSK